jgi:hypothetical protein
MMSDAGGRDPGVSGITLNLDDEAEIKLPDESLAPGTYKPADYDPSSDFSANIFPPPPTRLCLTRLPRRIR